MKHEHFHYHYPTKDSHYSGNHPTLDEINGLSGRTGIITSHGKYEIYSKPVVMESNLEKYKHQYKGEPYKKRADDEEPYFPIDENSDNNSQLETQNSSADKNHRNLE